jgi:hypothetical protein
LNFNLDSVPVITRIRIIGTVLVLAEMVEMVCDMAAQVIKSLSWSSERSAGGHSDDESTNIGEATPILSLFSQLHIAI